MKRGGRLRIYRALLCAFPREFRESKGPELSTLFSDMCAEWDEAGKTLGIRFWASLILDTSIQAAGEWVSLCREGIGSVMAAPQTMKCGHATHRFTNSRPHAPCQSPNAADRGLRARRTAHTMMRSQRYP